VDSSLTPELEEALLEAIQRAEEAAEIAELASKEAQEAADRVRLVRQKIKQYKLRIAAIDSEKNQKVDLLKEEVLDFVKKAAKKSKALKKIAKQNKKAKEKRI
jgi:hypothetical protein